MEGGKPLNDCRKYKFMLDSPRFRKFFVWHAEKIYSERLLVKIIIKQQQQVVQENKKIVGILLIHLIQSIAVL